MYYVYILYSASADKYYIGSTSDVSARLQDHNHGTRPNQLKKFTAKHRPWELKLAIAAGATRSEAVRMERFIKRKKSRSFLESLIAAREDEEKLAQLVSVPPKRD
jgi:putative endonuclease